MGDIRSYRGEMLFKTNNGPGRPNKSKRGKPKKENCITSSSDRSK